MLLRELAYHFANTAPDNRYHWQKGTLFQRDLLSRGTLAKWYAGPLKVV